MQATLNPVSPAQDSIRAPQPVTRNIAIDAYRGMVMLLMMAEVLEVRKIAEAFKDNTTWVGDTWRALAYHQSHVDWTGCSVHDMIQPSFSFLVGVALPFSLASRLRRGESTTRAALHAATVPCSPSVRSVPRVLVPAWKNAAALRFRWELGSGHFASPAVPLNTSRRVAPLSLRQRPNRSEPRNPTTRNFHAHVSAAPVKQIFAGRLNGRTICGGIIKNGTAQSRRGRARDSKARLWVRRAARQSLARPAALCAPN